MHVAVVVEAEPPAEILDEAVRIVRSHGGTISVLALSQPVVVACSTGWFAPAVLTSFPQSSQASACEVARRVIERLPADIQVTHAACFGWQCSRLLGRLRSGEFDLILLAGWPTGPFTRRALLRAARAGNTPIWGPPRRGKLLGLPVRRPRRASGSYAPELASLS
jgi:hypothetical protein